MVSMDAIENSPKPVRFNSFLRDVIVIVPVREKFKLQNTITKVGRTFSLKTRLDTQTESTDDTKSNWYNCNKLETKKYITGFKKNIFLLCSL